jgi:hypothetical protein
MPGKRIDFDPATLATITQLARDRDGTFQELADEAFRDLLKKYRRPTTLRGALKESVRQADPDSGPGKGRAHARRRSAAKRTRARRAAG